MRDWAAPADGVALPVSVLVPLAGDATRLRVWRWLQKRYQRLHPNFEIVIGRDGSDSFAKATAVNQAAREAAGSILVIADADIYVPAAVLEEAVAAAPSSPWVVPHGWVERINPAATDRILSEDPEDEPDVYNGELETTQTVCRGGGLIVLSPPGVRRRRRDG